jgi:dihydrofolate synthase/folylpolyglutamate synthase
MAPEDLAVIARDLGFEAEAADDVPTAIAQAQSLSPEATRILICGSLYLAGHVLALQDGVTPQPN